MCEHSTKSQRGFALFLGLIFLLMITLVAVTAMRGTSLELAMANNTALREEAFEGAEAARSSLIKSILPMLSCKRWPLGAKLTSGGGAACAVADCTRGRDGAGNRADYPWEPRLTLDDTTRLISSNPPGQDPNNPSAYAPRFTLKFGPDSTGIAKLGAAQLPVSVPPGSGAAQALGYEGLGGGGSRFSGAIFYDLTSASTLQSARPSVGGHYRAMTRDISPDNCETDLVYGS